MDALLLTKDHFLIHLEICELNNSSCTGDLHREVGVQVSRNLYQYFRADSEIVSSSEDLLSHRGNIITIAYGTEPKQSLLSSYPITVSTDKGVCVRDSEGDQHSYAFCSGLGIVCLRPYPQERLEALVWGSDIAGLRYAARLLPMLTVSKCWGIFLELIRRRFTDRHSSYESLFFLDCYWILHPVRKLALMLAFSRGLDSPILSSWAVTALGKDPMEYLRWDFWTICGMSQQIPTSHSVVILIKAASASTACLQ